MSVLGIEALENLRKNCDTFFNDFLLKHKNNMKCDKKCSRCCHTSFSVFELEAVSILNWFHDLSVEEKLSLKEKLLQTKEENLSLGQNSETASSQFPNAKVKCSFLHNDLCSIYEARPIICRTQGASLLTKETTKNGDTLVQVDCCPLNFTEENSFPKQSEALDLNRLNSLLSIAENFYQANKELGDGAVELNKMKDKSGRIALKNLAAYMLAVSSSFSAELKDFNA